MPAFIDLTGQKFGRLTVISLYSRATKKPPQQTKWLCKCDCGNEKIASREGLIKGKTNSCGCLRKEITAKRRRIHSKTRTRLYKVWISMKARCNNPNNKRYSSYGGRGITICDEWLHDFQAFYDWATANGYDETANFGQCTIDRIDNDKGYSPDNCRWVTMAEQNKNKRADNGYKIKE